MKNTRRQFMKQAGIAGIAFPSFVRSANSSSPNSRLQHASIGLGNMGIRDFKEFLSHEPVDMVALCDVDSRRLAMAAELAPKARRYTDWRELLEKEHGRIDSINIATPDHMHATVAYHAIKNGWHVYCQKPMCHDVVEVRVLTEMAAKKGVVTQLGTQYASSIGDRMTAQLLEENAIGRVSHVYLAENRPGAIERYRLLGPRPAKGEAPPPEMNWDLYLGTAPKRDFSPDLYHQTVWRSWQDFGTGWLGDIGCHIFSASWRGLGLQAPKTIKARVQESWKNHPGRFRDTWPQTEHATWVFPGNNKTGMKDLTVEWFDGLWYPPKEAQDILGRPGRYPAQSAMIVGEEGAILQPHKHEPILLPFDKYQDFKKPEQPPMDHYRNYTDACIENSKALADFEITGRLTEAVLLGTVAIRVPDTTLKWDSKRMKFLNNNRANSLLQRTYRKGWQVKGLG